MLPQKHIITYYSYAYERQLIDVTVVRRVRPRAERRYHAYHHVRTYRFLPADTRYIRYILIWNDCTPHASWYHKVWYIRIWYIIRSPLKPRLDEHTNTRTNYRFFFLDVAIRNSLRSNKFHVATKTHHLLVRIHFVHGSTEKRRHHTHPRTYDSRVGAFRKKNPLLTTHPNYRRLLGVSWIRSRPGLVCCTQEHDGDDSFYIREFHIPMRHYVY